MPKWLLLRLFQIMFILIILTSFSSETSRTATKNSPQSTCQLKNSVIGSAGVPTTSTNYQANGTLGQWTTIGTSSGANQDLYAGFWYLIWIQTPTGISVPFIYTNKLFQNYPNPFNPTTTIEYEVGKNSNVDITVYNVMGKRVKRLVDENKSPGHYQATWDGITDRGETVASGVYFYRIQIGNFRAVKKMVLLK